MIDFIIVEDNLSYVQKYKEIIDIVMIQYDIDYNISIYDTYSIEKIKTLEKDTFKIYILDYHKNILELLHYIREKLDDWQSLFILLFSNLEEKEEVIKRNLLIVDYINKNNNLEQALKRNIQICLKNYDQRPNSLKYCYRKTYYNIEYRKILYIEKEQDNKRCIIKTEKKDYYIQGNLSKIESLLDKRFIKCNRSYIVNIEQVESYNSKNNILTFKNKITLNVISRSKKKEIINYLRGINVEKK